MMRVLTDRHHHALLESLAMLIEDRFGGALFAPYGMDWFEREYWQFEKQWHGDAVARQYLLGVWGDPDWSSGQPVSPDPKQPSRLVKGITLDEALTQSWDFVICSLPHNYDGFYRLAQETGATYGIQIGNEAQPFDPRAAFCLSSSTLPDHGPEWVGRQFDYCGVPTILYHQEFSLDIFRHEWPPSTKAIGSFIQCFAENREWYAEFREVVDSLPGLDWRVYGGYGSAPVDELAAGNIDPVPEIADVMRSMRIIWHQKGWGDGYGHVIHNAFAIGRPVVGRASYYAPRLAGPLWVDGVTSFDIDSRPRAELAAILTRLIENDDYHRQISANAAARFREVVSFDADAEAIHALLESVA